MSASFNPETTVIAPALASPPTTDRPPPLSSRVKLEIAATSHPGKVRKNNEDHFLTARYGRSAATIQTNLPPGNIPGHYEETGYALVVADGMGGTSAGEVASRMAITAAVNLALDSPMWHLGTSPEENEAQERTWRERFREMDNHLARLGWSDPALSGMGTTLTIGCVVGASLFIYHVGDSRVYLYRRGKLVQLTSDHTTAQAMADAGLIDQASVARHRQRHALTRYLGGGREVEAETQQISLHDGDRLLFCSDGLTEMVNNERIADVLGREMDPNLACEELVQHALDAGGKDNVTVIVANYCLPANR